MAEVKIGVGANVGGVDAAIQKITASMNKLGAAVSANQKLRFEPTDVKLMSRDLALINKQFQQTLALSGQLRNALKATGQSGAHLSQIDFSKLSADPRIAQRMRDRAFLHSVRGTALDPTAYNETDANGNIIPPAPPGGGAGGGTGGSGGGGGGSGRRPRRGGGGGAGRSGGDDEQPTSWWRRRPGGSLGTATALAAGNGIGGPIGNIVTAGIAGGPIGALLAGVTSTIGKGMEWSEQGMEQAKVRNVDLDTLKRQMGDLGVSFSDLSEQSWKAAQGLGIANGEFVKLEGQANAESGGAYRTPAELATASRSGADLGRAYGLDPSQGVNFVSGMQRMNSRQNNKELATQLAEAIVNAQGKATPGEVMQAMQGFAAAQNRFNAVNPNPNVFGNAYGSMLTGDMTADHASSILGTANASMQRMGGTEASRNFLMQQFGMDPIRAQLRAEGGLFSNGLDNQDVSGFMSRRGVKDWDSQNKGPAGSNLAVTMQGLDRAYSGRGQNGVELELDAVKNMFGLKSLGDAASLANASTSDHNGIDTVLKNAGVGVGDVREGGLQAIAGISKAGSFDDLDKLYRMGPDAIRNRKDMQPGDIAAMDKAEQSGNFQQMQNEMVRVLSGKGQEDTQATTQQKIDANISDIKSQIGSYLIPLAQAGTQAVVWMANKIGAGISLPSPDVAKTGAGAPYGFGGGTPDANARIDQTGMAAGPLNSIANGVDAGNAWADGLADKANYLAGKGMGLAWKYNGAVNDGMKQLADMGIDSEHAAAIMANAAAESSMNPTARNGNMYGLFQLDKGRQADYQKVMGKSVIGSSQANQLAYMVKSMQAGGEEAGPGKDFWNGSGGDLAGYFARKIERTDHPGKNGMIRDGIASQITVIVEQTNNTNVNGQIKTKKLSATINPPSSSGSTHRVAIPSNNTNS